jgi:hypothetical protein
MKEVFVKKYWTEEDVLFYLHFQNGEAVRQLEVTPKKKIFLTTETPQKDNSMLYDQLFDELDFQELDFITKEEFNEVWNYKEV